MLGPTVHAGSLERIWKLPRRHFVKAVSKSTLEKCPKSYFAFNSRALAKEFQRNTPQELAATLRDWGSTGNGEALVAWRDVREIIARLRRLYNILDDFKDKKTRGEHWRLLKNLRTVAQEVEDITQQL